MSLRTGSCCCPEVSRTGYMVVQCMLTARTRHSPNAFPHRSARAVCRVIYMHPVEGPVERHEKKSTVDFRRGRDHWLTGVPRRGLSSLQECQGQSLQSKSPGVVHRTKRIPRLTVSRAGLVPISVAPETRGRPTQPDQRMDAVESRQRWAGPTPQHRDRTGLCVHYCYSCNTRNFPSGFLIRSYL